MAIRYFTWYIKTKTEEVISCNEIITAAGVINHNEKATAAGITGLI